MCGHGLRFKRPLQRRYSRRRAIGNVVARWAIFANFASSFLRIAEDQVLGCHAGYLVKVVKTTTRAERVRFRSLLGTGIVAAGLSVQWLRLESQISREVNVTNPLRWVLFGALTAFAISLFPTVGSAIAPTKKCATSNDCQPGAHCRHSGQGRNAKMGVCVGG
jgi:hypothetical protein